VRHFQRALADRPGRSENDHACTFHNGGRVRSPEFSATARISRHMDHQAQVEKQNRRGEEQAIDQIERAANSGEQIA
jgi:hypothetical protein